MYSILRISWTFTCIFATLSTMIWQLSNYYNGEEQTIVEYRKFNEMDNDIYPSLTLCWDMAIDEEKLQMYGNNFSSSAYTRFLRGLYWDEEMLKVDYDDIKLNLNDYILLYGYKTASRRKIRLYDKQGKVGNKLGRGRNEKPGYKEYSFFSTRCFTMDIPFTKGQVISRFELYFKSSIFGKEGRLSSPFGAKYKKRKFLATIHYRNQLVSTISSVTGMKNNWPSRDPGSSKSYMMLLRCYTN